MPLDGTGFVASPHVLTVVLTETEARDLAVLRLARHRIRYRWLWDKGDIVKWRNCWRHCALSAFHADYNTSVAYRLHAQLPSGWQSVAAYNDHPTTTHADVLALFDRAIGKLEAGALLSG